MLENKIFFCLKMRYTFDIAKILEITKKNKCKVFKDYSYKYIFK